MDTSYALKHTIPMLARAVGTSTRTVSRWKCGDSRPSDEQLGLMARLVYPKDASLARELAAAASTTVEALGLVPPPAPAVPLRAVGARHLAGAVLAAAAETLDISPRTLRPALIAAFKTMDDLGLDARTAALGLAEETVTR
jgi:hypothetical protein